MRTGRRAPVEGRIRVDAVDREAPARAGLCVAGVVVRADVDGVAPVGREARRGEGVRPVAAREARRLEVLEAGREGASVPVEAGADALNGDVHGLDAGGRIGVRAVEAVRPAARVPAGVRVDASGGREREERAGIRVVDPEGAARARLGVRRIVRRPHMDGVGAVRREAPCGEGVRPVAGRERHRLEDLGGASEGLAVPVVAGSPPDGDLGGLDAGGRVGVRAAEPTVPQPAFQAPSV